MKKIFLILFVIASAAEQCHSQGVWTQKATQPDYSGVSLSIGTKGYFLSDGSQIFFEYDPSSNSWIQKANFPGIPRASHCHFSIGGKGYVGDGVDQGFSYLDFWEFDPNGNGINENEFENSISVYPNPFSTEAVLEIKDSGFRNKDLQMQMYDVDGKMVFKSQILIPKSLIKRSNLPSGVYFLHITSDNASAVKRIVIN